MRRAVPRNALHTCSVSNRKPALSAQSEHDANDIVQATVCSRFCPPPLRLRERAETKEVQKRRRVSTVSVLPTLPRRRRLRPPLLRRRFRRVHKKSCWQAGRGQGPASVGAGPMTGEEIWRSPRRTAAGRGTAWTSGPALGQRCGTDRPSSENGGMLGPMTGEEVLALAASHSSR